MASSTTSSSVADECRPLQSEAIALSGRRYAIEHVLQDKHIAFGRVYQASRDDQKYVLKEIPQDYGQRIQLYDRVGDCPHARKPVDTVPDQRMLVFEYLHHNFLHSAQLELRMAQTKHILKRVLQGIAGLHERDIVHLDIKANNVFFNAEQTSEGLSIDTVQLADLEDADYLPPNKAFSGAKLANWMWRSPEAHAEGPVKKPSDMFSFGVVCIFAVTKKVIFDVDESALEEGVDKLAVVLERQLSYFASKDGLHGFLEYLGEDHPWREIFQVIEDGFSGDQVREPFASWQREGLDDVFKDLVGGLTISTPLGG